MNLRLTPFLFVGKRLPLSDVNRFGHSVPTTGTLRNNDPTSKYILCELSGGSVESFLRRVNANNSGV